MGEKRKETLSHDPLFIISLRQWSVNCLQLSSLSQLPLLQHMWMFLIIFLALVNVIILLSELTIYIRHNFLQYFQSPPSFSCKISLTPFSCTPPHLFQRFSATVLPSTVQISWMMEAVWLYWWWGSCCWLRSWFWLWPLTAGWRATSSWACASSPTAVPSTRTCLHHVIEAWGAAVTSRGQERARERVACGFEQPKKKSMVNLMWIAIAKGHIHKTN